MLRYHGQLGSPTRGLLGIHQATRAGPNGDQIVDGMGLLGWTWFNSSALCSSKGQISNCSRACWACSLSPATHWEDAIFEVLTSERDEEDGLRGRENAVEESEREANQGKEVHFIGSII
jgi:hypothetical protein